jgi:hypothetical protein
VSPLVKHKPISALHYLSLLGYVNRREPNNAAQNNAAGDFGYEINVIAMGAYLTVYLRLLFL